MRQIIKYFIPIPFFLIIFSPSCLVDIPSIDIYKNSMIPDSLKIYQKVDLDNRIILIKDSLGTISTDKSVIFYSNPSGYKYAYGDLLPLDDAGHLLVASQRSRLISDFGEGEIVVSESFDHGKTWSEPFEIININNSYLNISAPSIVRITDKHLMLFYAVKYSIGRIDIQYIESFDNGKTWSNSKFVYGEKLGYQTLNNGRVRYENGRIIVPVAMPNTKYQSFDDSTDDLGVLFYYSDDLGETWQRSAFLLTNNNEFGLMEPGIIQLSDKEYLMNIRINRGTVLFARSLDSGKNWIFEPSNIQSSDSPQTLLKINNKLVMIWNDNPNRRNILSLALSNDKGKSWNKIFDIEKNNANYSYVSMSEDQNFIYITYYDLLYHQSSSLNLLKINKKDLLNL